MYKVTYIENGIKHQEIVFETDSQEIYRNFIKKNRIVLKIQKTRNLSFLKGNQEELARILQSLSDLLNSGLSLSSALRSLSSSIDDKNIYKSIFMSIHNQILTGKTFAEATSMYGAYFGETTVQMIKAGYETGNLPKVLETTSQYLIELSTIKKNILKKLTYPISVFVLSIIMLTINARVIIPKLMKSELFTIVSKEGATQILIHILKIFSVVVPLFILVLILGLFVVLILFKTKQKSVEQFLLKIPFIKEIVFYRSFFISFYSLQRLISSGVKLSNALKIIERVNTIYTIKNEFNNAYNALKKGEPFINGFRYLSKLDKQILSWSMNQERLSQNMEIIAKRFYERYISAIQKLSPVLYIGSLSLVLFIFLVTFFSVIVPYLKLLVNIGQQ